MRMTKLPAPLLVCIPGHPLFGAFMPSRREDIRKSAPPHSCGIIGLVQAEACKATCFKAFRSSERCHTYAADITPGTRRFGNQKPAPIYISYAPSDAASLAVANYIRVMILEKHAVPSIMFGPEEGVLNHIDFAAHLQVRLCPVAAARVRSFSNTTVREFYHESALLFSPLSRFHVKFHGCSAVCTLMSCAHEAVGPMVHVHDPARCGSPAQLPSFHCAPGLDCSMTCCSLLRCRTARTA